MYLHIHTYKHITAITQPHATQHNLQPNYPYSQHPNYPILNTLTIGEYSIDAATQLESPSYSVYRLVVVRVEGKRAGASSADADTTATTGAGANTTTAAGAAADASIPTNVGAGAVGIAATAAAANTKTSSTSTSTSKSSSTSSGTSSSSSGSNSARFPLSLSTFNLQGYPAVAPVFKRSEGEEERMWGVPSAVR